MAAAELSDRPNRSLNGNQSTYVTFENESDHNVAVLWLDYNGNPVWYNNLCPGSSYHQQTYVTHPWLCVECDSGLFALMKINKQDVLFPETKQISAVITTGEASLFQQCLAAVRMNLHEVLNVSLVESLQEGDICELPLPKRCIVQLLEFDSGPPPSLAEKYVNKIKGQLKQYPQTKWNPTLSNQIFSLQ